MAMLNNQRELIQWLEKTYWYKSFITPFSSGEKGRNADLTQEVLEIYTKGIQWMKVGFSIITYNYN